MSTKDVIKNSVLEGFTTGEVTWSQILMTIAIAFVIGLFIMFIYKRTFSGVVFTRSFATSLILLSDVYKRQAIGSGTSSRAGRFTSR